MDSFLEAIIASVSLTTIDDLNDDALGLVLWKASEYSPTLALTCRRWSRVVASKRASWKAASLQFLARRGHKSLLAWSRNNWPYLIDAPSLLTASASEKHWSLCSMIMSWKAGDNPVCLARGAAQAGDTGMLEVALDWMVVAPMREGLVIQPAPIMWIDEMLVVGARHGHEAVCRIARDRGAFSFGEMLDAAIQGGHENLCRLAWDWHGRHHGRHPNMYSESALLSEGVDYDSKHGGVRMCSLIKEWGATDYDSMLERAALEGSERLCRQARDWGANDFDLMLMAAATGGNEHLCHLAIDWGAREYVGMLTHAAMGGHLSLCHLARDLLRDKEARSNEEMGGICQDALEIAGETLHEAVCCQLLDWGASPDMLLSVAVECRNLRLCRLALERGADLAEVFDDVESTNEYLNEFERFVCIAPLGSCDELLFFGAGIEAEELFFGAEIEAEELVAVDDENRTGEGYELCDIALREGARHVDWLLCKGAYIGAWALCHLAVRHGARDFNGMLLGACAGEQPSLIELAREWGATTIPPSIDDLRHIRSE
jgi:hypothetical protein